MKYRQAKKAYKKLSPEEREHPSTRKANKIVMSYRRLYRDRRIYNFNRTPKAVGVQSGATYAIRNKIREKGFFASEKEEYLTLTEIAKDLQETRGYPNIEALIGSGMLKSYTFYRDVSDALSEEEWKQAITEGFNQAEDA